jgi:hypothetical protein
MEKRTIWKMLKKPSTKGLEDIRNFYKQVGYYYPSPMGSKTAPLTKFNQTFHEVSFMCALEQLIS